MNNEKEIYETPSAEIVPLAFGDIITLSGGGDYEGEIIPSPSSLFQ